MCCSFIESEDSSKVIKEKPHCNESTNGYGMLTICLIVMICYLSQCPVSKIVNKNRGRISVGVLPLGKQSFDKNITQCDYTLSKHEHLIYKMHLSNIFTNYC